MRPLVLLLVATLSSAVSFSQSSQQNVVRRMDQFVSSRDFSGVVLVARDGRVLFQKAYGMANNGLMRDIGTLGGPDSFAAGGCNNQQDGLVTGTSFINSTPNSDTGLLTTHPFLWENGKKKDLGTLGGTFGFAQCANNRGQVIGQSNLA
jgi:probable HAF family extracellular repeat protein